MRLYKTIKRAFCATLFSKKISAADADQANIGDCYFVSSLAAIADREPAIIEKVIKEVDPTHYKVIFNDVFDFDLCQYKPTPWYGKTLEINNKLPQESGTYKYSYTRENPDQEWFALLEKAYATWKGSYEAIGGGGYPDVALAELTGRTPTTVSTEIKYFKSEAMRANTLLGIFEKADRNNWKVVVSTRGQGELQDPQNPDVYSGHAYSYHGYNHVTHLIKLRNPWGEGSNPEGFFNISVPDFLKYYDYIYYVA